MGIIDERTAEADGSRGVQAAARAGLFARVISRFPHATRAAGLVAVALVVGAVFNACNPLGIRWTLSPDGRVGIPRVYERLLPEISAAEAITILRKGGAVFIDSRDEKDFRKDHIPGAINVPMRKWAELESGVIGRLPRDPRYVLYCYGGACGLSTRMGKRLLELGYTHPIVLRRGWAEWTKAGYPTVRQPKGKAA